MKKLEKLTALLLVVMMVFSLAACGKKDPNLGKYKVVSCSESGYEEDWIELKKGGKGTYFSGFEFKMTWELDGEDFTGTISFLGLEDTMTGKLKDGVLWLTYGYVDYVFAKDGATVPDEAPDTEPETPDEPETPENAGAPVADTFFVTPTEWNGFVIKDEEILDAFAVLDIDEATEKMYFDVYLDIDTDNAFYSAYVEPQEDRSLYPIIGDEDAWIDELYLAAGDEYTYSFYRNYEDGIVLSAEYPGTDGDGYELMMYFKKSDAEWNPDGEMLPPDQSDIKLVGDGPADEPHADPEDDPADTPVINTSDVEGEMFNAGNFSAFVPEGWKAFTVIDVFAEEDGALDPDALQICKGGVTDLDIFSKPYVDIRYYGVDTLLWTPTKDWYDNAEDITPFTAGNFTWEGFTATSYEQPVIVLWAVDGDIEYQVSIWSQPDESMPAVSYTDADVQAILKSLDFGN